jgi:hypothetical protein
VTVLVAGIVAVFVRQGDGEPQALPTPTPSRITASPTGQPTSTPTGQATSTPTEEPTQQPTEEPTQEPSVRPTKNDPDVPDLPRTGVGGPVLVAFALVASAIELGRRTHRLR